MPEITRELVKALAAAQGLNIVDERVELVRREYENFVQLTEQIAKLPLPPETEPRSSTNEQ